MKLGGLLFGPVPPDLEDAAAWSPVIHLEDTVPQEPRYFPVDFLATAFPLLPMWKITMSRDKIEGYTNA